MKADILALAIESASNSKSAKKLSWCIAIFIATSTMVIVFCLSVVFMILSAFDSMPRGRILALSQSADGQYGARLTSSEIESLVGSSDVEDILKFNCYSLTRATIKMDNNETQWQPGRKIKSIDTESGEILMRYMRGSDAVTGSGVLGVGEAIITRDIADELGYGDRAVGEKISISMEGNYWSEQSFLDDDTDPNNLPINAVERDESYQQYPVGGLNISVIDAFTVVGVLETNSGRKAVPSLGVIEQAEGSYYTNAPFSAGESGVWINSKSVYRGVEMTPQVRNHSMYDSVNSVIDASVLTYNFTDYNIKSREVTGSGYAFIMISGMVGNGAHLADNVSLEPIDTYYVQFKSFNAGKRWYDSNVELLKERYNASKQEHANVIGGIRNWQNFIENTMDTKFSNLYTSQVVLEFALKLIAIFGGLLLISLIVGLCNVTAIYNKSKANGYNNLGLLGANRVIIKSYRRADIVIACLKGIAIGGCIIALLEIALFAAMFSALSLAITLGAKEILVMLGLSVATFTTLSVSVTATMLVASCRLNKPKIVVRSN